MKKDYLYISPKKILSLIFGNTIIRILALSLPAIFLVFFDDISSNNSKLSYSVSVNSHKSINGDIFAVSVESAKEVKLLVAAIKKEDIGLYSVGYGRENVAGFDKFILNIKGKSKAFNWTNIKNPIYYPQMLYKDINKDGKKELIIINTVGKGGELKKEVHIIDTADLNEIQLKVSMDDIFESPVNYKDRIDNSVILKLMFPDKVFSKYNGTFTDKTAYPYSVEFNIEFIEKGAFTKQGNEEYLVVVKETGQTHIMGLENRYAAVINNTKTGLMSSVKKFEADDGQIVTFKGKSLTYIFFTGTRTYQGYTYSSDNSEIGLWKAGQEWQRLWQKNREFWEDNDPMASKDGINIYTRRTFTDDFSKARKLYAWELKSILKWDAESETFVDENDI